MGQNSTNNLLKRMIAVAVIITVITTVLSVCQTSAAKVQAAPLQLTFSHKGGWYESAFSLTLSSNNPEAEIYYTLDGSEPDFENNTATGLYDSTKKIPIYDKKFQLNNYSAMNFIWNGAQPYVKATEYQPKCTTVKAFAVYNGERTNTITENYFIDPELQDKYGVKVISLTGDPEDFFGDGGTNIGFMRNTSQNPDNVNAHVQMFDENGKEIINQNINVKMHGAFSRSFNQKTFRLRADEDYDANHNKFEYAFFNQLRDINGKVIKKYKRLLARNGGNDCNNAMLRDAFNSRLVNKMGFGVLASEPAVIYHCGEFYGVCNIRERYDDHYINDHYNIEREDVILITTHGFELNEGVPGVDDREWLNLVSFVNNSDMTDSDNYKEFEQKVDVDNYINYCIAQLYIANTDWANNNVRVWKSKGNLTDEEEEDTYGVNGVNYNDGRWRYLLYDTDISSGVFHPNNNFGGQPTNHNFDSLEYLSIISVGGTGFDLLHLLENKTFRKKFVDIYVNNINTTFKYERVSKILDEVSSPMEKSMPYQVNRFGLIKDMDTWKKNLLGIKNFYRPRAEAVLNQLNEKWQMGNECTFTLERIEENPDDYTVSGVELEPIMLGNGKWSGTYFPTNTIEVECDLSNGEKFGAWEITDSKGTRVLTNEKLHLNISSDTTVRVIYKSEMPTPTPEPTPELTLEATPEVTGTPEITTTPEVRPTTTTELSATSTPEISATPSMLPTATWVAPVETTPPGGQEEDSQKCLVVYNGNIDTVVKGESFSEPEKPVRKKHTFIGWYTDEKFTEKVTFPMQIEKNMILYARFEKNPTAIKKKNIKIRTVSKAGGKTTYKIKWKTSKKQKKLKYRVEVSHSKKDKHFKTVTKFKKKKTVTITARMLKKAKVKMGKKYYFRVLCGKKVSGVWCVSYSRKIRI